MFIITIYKHFITSKWVNEDYLIAKLYRSVVISYRIIMSELKLEARILVYYINDHLDFKNYKWNNILHNDIITDF